MLAYLYQKSKCLWEVIKFAGLTQNYTYWNLTYMRLKLHGHFSELDSNLSLLVPIIATNYNALLPDYTTKKAVSGQRQPWMRPYLCL